MGCLNAKIRYGSEKVECICTLTEFSPEFCDDETGRCMNSIDQDQREWCSGYESDLWCPGCGVDLNEHDCQCPSEVVWS